MALDAADRDPGADPGTDFYRFANGGWIDASAIPPGFGSWGAIEEVVVRNELILGEELRRAADGPRDEIERALGDYVVAGDDVDAVDAAGLSPVRHLLDAVAAVTTPEQLLDLLPDLHRDGVGLLLAPGVSIDHDDATRHLLWLTPSGLGLPDRESYVSDSEAAVSLRAAYVDHVAAQLANAGTDAAEAAALATAVLAFETRLAEPQLRAEERRDVLRTRNKRDLGQLDAMAPGLGLPRYLERLGASAADVVNVSQTDHLAALPDVVASTDPAVLRAYATFHVVRTYAEALPAVFDDEAFAFYGRRIGGLTEQKERWRRVVTALGQDMGEALSQLFVRAAFPESAKARARSLVDEIVAEMRTSLRTRTWMSEETRDRALAKLDAMRVKVGYPDEWRDWSGLVVGRESYAANRIACARFELARQLGKLGQPVDPGEWELPPHVVNAYYHPLRNEIVFLAGILQPPMFDADADDAVNFGGIGTVIAHEITHGFDDQGRRFDADGALRDWWTAQDEEHFSALAERLVEQYDAYVAVGEVHVNGRLTLGENIADLGGVALAQRAHARVSAGSPAVDGLTPSQRFFLANATLWRCLMSEERARTLAMVDPHSPRHLRVLGPLSNSDAFQDAFGLGDDAPMLRRREQRIEIW